MKKIRNLSVVSQLHKKDSKNTIRSGSGGKSKKIYNKSLAYATFDSSKKSKHAVVKLLYNLQLISGLVYIPGA